MARAKAKLDRVSINSLSIENQATLQQELLRSPFYRRWSAMITFNGSSQPTVDELVNEFDGVGFTVTRPTTGTYYITRDSGAYTQKIFLAFPHQVMDNQVGAGYVVGVRSSDDDYIVLGYRHDTDAPLDLDGVALVELREYDD